MNTVRAGRLAARTGGPLYGAGLAGLLCTIVLACTPADEPGIRYTPAAELPRLGVASQPVAGAGRIVDFELVGDALYLLEPDRVTRHVQRAEGWREELSFGRDGFGPGELSSATALSLAGEALLVTHATRVQWFSQDGALMDGRDLVPPCVMVRPRAEVATHGMFVHGMCRAAGYTTDTMKAVLAWAADGANYTALVQDVAFTRDGSVGSVFGARSAMTVGPHGVHAFGNGTSNCVWRVIATGPGGTPNADRVCPAVLQRYSAPAPPGVEARMRAGVGGTSMKWPSTLPDYVDRVDLGDAGIMLVRPFAADSVVLQLAGADAVDLAVAPLDGFAGCKAGGCLWLREDGIVPHGFVLWRTDALALAAAARRGGGGSP
jgi:hypothetical protein